MSYGDGGFYFLQPVGNGYSGVEVMLNPQRGGYGSMGRSRSYGGSASTAFTASQFDKIIDKFAKRTKALYAKAWGYAVGTKERKAAEKVWAEADRALGQLRVMKGSLKSAKWKYADLPSAVQTGIGSWVLSNVLKVAATETVPTVTVTRPGYYRPTTGIEVQASATGRQTAPGRKSPLAPSGQQMTLQMPVPPTVMGPQAAATDEQVAVTQAQTDLSQQAVQTVSAATEAAGGTGISGLLSTTTGKVVAGTAAAGVAYLLWRNRRSIFGG
jgi:hypothetical protein